MTSMALTRPQHRLVDSRSNRYLAKAVLALNLCVALAYASDAVSREVSVLAGGSADARTDAVAREVAVFAPDLANSFTRSDATSRELTIAIPVIAGDTNCDGSVNNFDIDPFVLALVNRPAYFAAFQFCPLPTGDANCDGSFDNFDIDPFVACIVSLPEPGQRCPNADCPLDP